MYAQDEGSGSLGKWGLWGFFFFLTLSFSSPLCSLFSSLILSNSPAESQIPSGWFLLDTVVCVFFTMLPHSHCFWEGSFCLDSEEQYRHRGVEVWFQSFVSSHRYLCTLIFFYRREGFFFFPFLAYDLDYWHGGIWAIYPLYMAQRVTEEKGGVGD